MLTAVLETKRTIKAKNIGRLRAVQITARGDNRRIKLGPGRSVLIDVISWFNMRVMEATQRTMKMPYAREEKMAPTTLADTNDNILMRRNSCGMKCQ